MQQQFFNELLHLALTLLPPHTPENQSIQVGDFEVEWLNQQLLVLYRELPDIKPKTMLAVVPALDGKVAAFVSSELPILGQAVTTLQSHLLVNSQP